MNPIFPTNMNDADPFPPSPVGETFEPSDEKKEPASDTPITPNISPTPNSSSPSSKQIKKSKKEKQSNSSKKSRKSKKTSNPSMDLTEEDLSSFVSSTEKALLESAITAPFLNLNTAMQQISQRDCEQLSNIVSEFLPTFVIIGFDFSGNRVEIKRASNQLGSLALDEAIRQHFAYVFNRNQRIIISRLNNESQENSDGDDEIEPQSPENGI